MNKKEKPVTCWLIGHPVDHSLSPGMHRVLYSAMGIKSWRYRKKDLDSASEIKKFIEKFLSNGDRGFNVTVPYKEKIIKLIDSAESAALEIGAVNTVLNDNGALKGFNTDWTGFRDDLKESLNIDRCRSALVLGAGGAGRAVVYALINSIADGTVYLYDKDIKRSEKLKDDIKNNGRIKVLKNMISAEQKSPGCELIVNATPVGMRPAPAVISLKDAALKLKVYDVVYNRVTELIRDAGKYGLKASGGAGMLAGQGAEAFNIWSKTKYGKVSKEIKEKMKDYIIKEVQK